MALIFGGFGLRGLGQPSGDFGPAWQTGLMGIPWGTRSNALKSIVRRREGKPDRRRAVNELQLKSLILAQIERWRHG